MNDGKADKVLMRTKDIILAVVGIGAVLLAAARWFDKPVIIESQVNAMSVRVDKHEDRLNIHDIKFGEADQRWDEIKRAMSRIEAKLDRR